jgi:hypothetical protein
MKNVLTILLFAFCVLCSFTSCNNGTTTQDVTLVTPEKLQAHFPEKLGDFKRMELGSELMNNQKMVQSSGLYQDPLAANRTLLVTIHDTGGNQEAIRNIAPWSVLQQNNKLEDNSYERTGTYNGYPSYEKFDEHYRSSNLSFIINKRFVVDVSGSVCFVYDLKGMLSDFNFKQLE